MVYSPTEDTVIIMTFDYGHEVPNSERIDLGSVKLCMKAWIYEWVVVLAYSNSAQWKLVVTLLGAFLIWLLGEAALSDFEFPGVLAPMAEPIRGMFEGRFNGLTLAFLLPGLVAVGRQLRRDRERLLGI